MKSEIDIHLLARINRVVLSYYAQADKFKTEVNFHYWVQTLSEFLKEDFKQKGFEDCKNSIPFMRYVLELNDIGMSEHMKNNLSSEDYLIWVSPDSNLIVPKELNILNLKDKSRLA